MSEQAEAPQVESQARSMGWVPKEEFRGPEERWIDANEFVRRGEEILPIVRAEKKKLEEKVQTLEQTIAAGQKSMEEFRKYTEEDGKRKVDAAIKKLKADIVEARREGDIDAEVEASNAIQKLTSAPTAKKADEVVDFTTTTWWKAWMEENPWYGTDTEKTAYAQGQGVYLNIMRKDLRERAFLDELTKLVQDKYPDSIPRRELPSKVEGSRPGSSQSSSKDYRDLPPDAKAACDKWADKLVGKGKTYATLSDWRKKYVSDFYAES